MVNLQLPGVDIDLRHYPQSYRKGAEQMYPIGAHHNCWGSNSAVLPIREVAMMMIMTQLTDKPNWHEKVFNDEIVAKWRKEAMEQSEDDLYSQITEGKDTKRSCPKPARTRIVSEKAFGYCIAELRDKAAFFKKTGLIHALDSDGNTIVKSDVQVGADLQERLRLAFEKLQAEQASDIDWHPRSGDRVQDLVHPSMYPFVYERSSFLHEPTVGVTNALDSVGKGETITAMQTKTVRTQFDFGLTVGGSSIPDDFWSDKYQWLPADLAFQDDGKVKFTSYVNNLHPNKHPEIYQTIEGLVDLAIPLWDQCLRELNRQDDPQRPGVAASRFKLPEKSNNEDDDLWEPFDPKLVENVEVKLGRYAISNYIQNHDGVLEQRPYPEENIIDPVILAQAKVHCTWEKIRDPIIPEPDEFAPADYAAMTSSIRDRFKDSGLQIIVKMATIELTPTKNEFPQGGWHVEGQMNERICATALYYLDSDNVTPSHLSFRMRTTTYQEDDLQSVAEQDGYHYLERVYGASFSNDACIQNYGSVETRQGRMLAFPNTFQHRVSPFKLIDPTRPGHRRFIALWLVDPNQRIISTANVPPQQQDWWTEAVFGSGKTANLGQVPDEVLQLLAEEGVAKDLPKEKLEGLRSRLPNEVMDMVRKQGVKPAGLMTVEEAKEHRIKLMDIRSRFHDRSEAGWNAETYSFCEH
ncbi:hypothetical protein B0T22DRAFT_499692 [Podospora appendiculata]|uniref:Uncharacterized protein n=1 Tax=Podospora appendiculata TaxID=314037 RepID=A0AAE1CE93_9PEZI|nr:hypothetical protein B0T22DRAFT_499692 [Podospora appendiculata]